jgi:predicted Zn-dependent protease
LRTAETCRHPGTQILYDSNYDARAMAQFFEKIQARIRAAAGEFFSNHPNPATASSA